MRPLSKVAMRVPRVPPGKLGLAVLAVALVPVVANEISKEWKKRKGGTSDKAEPPKAEVKEQKPSESPRTSQPSNRPAPSHRQPSRPANPNAASPTGKEEVVAQKTAATTRKSAPPKPKARKKATKDKAGQPSQPMNPKRTKPPKPR